ncbi:hypothetical protein Ciccas_001306 [Cichlidogyrus casuarinus]|uniref:Rab-GAP TBC domain-containing protein n=1 Tax=Cichlidogyrus casuarinus TaxID=1844966 RepID=A0ABD2QKJ2_9PLAT
MPFCLKWLLIHFKREFSYDETMELWEAFWACPFTQNFHLLFAAAILSQQKNKIISEQMDVNSILKFVNELSCHINLHDTLNLAQSFYHQLDEVKLRLPKDVMRIVYGPSLCASPHYLSKPLSSPNRNDLSTTLEHEWDLPYDQQEATASVHKGLTIVTPHDPVCVVNGKTHDNVSLSSNSQSTFLLISSHFGKVKLKEFDSF